jgi:hypothetical protein
MKKKKICVVDGQGGGIGGAIIKKLKEKFRESIEITALGTNAIATANMLKAKANRGASGENAVLVTVKTVDVIIGSVSIVLANAMMGEVTPKIAEAIASCQAKKILIPILQENVDIAGVQNMPLPHFIDEIIEYHLTNIII